MNTDNMIIIMFFTNIVYMVIFSWQLSSISYRLEVLIKRLKEKNNE